MKLTTNLHTHTERCNHAVGEDRAYVEAAIAAGLTTLGFSDHVPMPYRNHFHSHIRMRVNEIEDYTTSILSLREAYKDDIRILLGYEAEYDPELFPAMMKEIGQYPLDYLIFGAHFIENEYAGFYSGSPTDSESDLIAYVENVLAGFSTGVYTYLAHPDLIHYIGPDEIYVRHMRRICEKAKELSIPLEINMNGLFWGNAYPADRFWKLAKECGNTIVVGFDAHNPALFSDAETKQKTEALVERLGLTVTYEIPIKEPHHPILP